MSEYFHPSFSKGSIAGTIKTWQSYSKEPLTEKDATEIIKIGGLEERWAFRN